MSTNNTCLTACPTIRYFADVNHNCQPCDSTCNTCNGGLATNCLSCNTSTRLFFEASTSTCLTCSDNCTFCNGVSYNCTNCSINTLQIFYLYTNTTDPNTSYCRQNLTSVKTEDSAIVVASEAINIAASVVAIGCIPLILTGGMGTIWNALDILQMMYFYAFLNLNVPENFIRFLLMLKFAQLLLPNIADSLMTNVSVNYNILIPEQPTYEKFTDQNLDANFFRNGAFMVIYICMTFSATIVLQYIEKLYKRITGKDTFKHILMLMKWNFTIRYILTNTAQLAFSASLQLPAVEFDSVFTVISSILAIISMVFLVLFILSSIYIMSLMNFGYSSHHFSEKFNALFDEFNQSKLRKSSIVKHYQSIITLRKISFVSMIELAYYNPKAILICLLLQSILMVVIIYYCKPFQRDAFNSKNIIHEIILISFIIIMLLIDLEVIYDQKSIEDAG